MFKPSFIALTSLVLSAWMLTADAAQQKAFFCLGLSPFRDGQSPNLSILPTVDQIREDIQKMKPYTENVRCYGNNGSLLEFPRLCTEEGVGLFLGVWLDGKEWDQPTIDVLKQQLQGPYAACIKGVVVGSECFLRYTDQGGAAGLPASKIVEYINQVKAVAGDIPVATAESYWHLANLRPQGGQAIGDACDYILYHVHPYWNNVSAEHAASNVIDVAYKAMTDIWPDKEAICGETGYPTAGKDNPLNLGTTDQGPSHAGVAEQTTFLKALVEKNHTANIKYMWFSAFDEAWKATDGESNACNCGAHWGLWNADRTPKATVEAFQPVLTLPTNHFAPVSNGNITITNSAIKLRLVNPSAASLKLYSLQGKMVRDLDRRVQLAPAGDITLGFEHRQIVAGSYVVRFNDGAQDFSRSISVK